MRVLFVCTGNYYRSRFAEHLFNHLCAGAPTADSRALMQPPDLYDVNDGSISPHTLRALRERSIPLPDPPREQLPLEEGAWRAFDRVVFMDREEHGPMVADREDIDPDDARIFFWEVPDVHLLDSRVALDRVALEVEALVREIGSI